MVRAKPKGTGKSDVGAQSTPATLAARRAGIAFSLHTYVPPSGGGSLSEDVATAIGMPAEQVFKTLVVTVDEQLTVGVLPVGSSLNLKALASTVGGKRGTLANQAAAERATGYVRGGISPLGQRRQLPIVVDGSALRHASICVSAGRRGLQLELSPVDLIRVAGARTGSIAAQV
ncbi:aminoacyl-tRNA deacylase [Lipingzhangella sp. LS1_29]|uniref:Cys-tRNA(Pro)/Cys-tRNA(Cys) deacylase n=1 Tax=Lipingzhangella rawalii TaxID=2055835 RepID=A0ABU2H5J6_9ACTN|nr:aminoacyl-tRNA deacylase [Lipingzhangella rawalii]MDS1270272.1 aminoacyl-tRNA deacylase [Lipingzhangella rawalii]